MAQRCPVRVVQLQMPIGHHWGPSESPREEGSFGLQEHSLGGRPRQSPHHRWSCPPRLHPSGHSAAGSHRYIGAAGLQDRMSGAWNMSPAVSPVIILRVAQTIVSVRVREHPFMIKINISKESQRANLPYRFFSFTGHLQYEIWPGRLLCSESPGGDRVGRGKCTKAHPPEEQRQPLAGWARHSLPRRRGCQAAPLLCLLFECFY